MTLYELIWRLIELFIKYKESKSNAKGQNKD